MATTANTNQTRIEKATDSVLDLVKKANDYAIDTTEQAFDASFKLADKSLNITSKVVRKGLEISATQQEFAFDLFNGVKRKVFKK